MSEPSSGSSGGRTTLRLRAVWEVIAVLTLTLILGALLSEHLAPTRWLRAWEVVVLSIVIARSLTKCRAAVRGAFLDWTGPRRSVGAAAWVHAAIAVAFVLATWRYFHHGSRTEPWKFVGVMTILCLIIAGAICRVVWDLKRLRSEPGRHRDLVD